MAERMTAAPRVNATAGGLGRLRSGLVAVALVAGAVLLTLAAVNFALARFSPVLMRQPYFPRAWLNSVDGCYHTFYPGTFGGDLRGHVAVVGDSYGAGAGDEFLGGEGGYGIFPKLRARTGDNYLIFARSGFGSVHAARELLACADAMNSSLLLPDIGTPGKILVLFYEGNDLDNNIRQLAQARWNGDADAFVAGRMALGLDDRRWRKLRFPLYYLLRDRVFHMGPEAARRPGRGWAGGHDGEAGAGAAREPEAGGAGRNGVLIQGSPRVYPVDPQGAALELGAELEVAQRIFFRSVLGLRARFPEAALEIVYLPSVVTAYPWRDRVRIQAYHSAGPVYTTTAANEAHSLRIRKAVAGFAAANGFGFVDTTDAVRAAAGGGLVHGPRDWKHFNARGYRAVADAL